MLGVETGITGEQGKAGVMASTPQASEPASAEPSSEGGSSDGGDNAASAANPLETAAVGSSPSGKTVVTRKASSKDVGAPAPAPAYAPNHKFKVLDKEHEFDDWAKSAAKDPETEKKVRELYEKAYGLDSVKQDRQTLKQELAESKEKYAQTEKAIETLGEFVRSDDFDSFFESLRIPKEKILRYAIALVQREQMSPEQRQQWEASRQAQQQARYYSEQNQTLQQQQQQFQIQQRDYQLQMEISKPEVSRVAEAYNAGMANPSAFKNYVIKIGQAYVAMGQDISVEQAVGEAIRDLRAVNPSLGVQPQAVAAPAAPQVVQASNKPVIPNIQGRGTSAVKSTIKSLDDIKARARELESRS